MSAEIIQGDVMEVLPTLPEGSVHCCVTSPPYFGLRDYGTAKWEGGDPACDHKRRDAGRSNTATCNKCGARRLDSQIGLESSPAEYVEKLVTAFREVRRVLRPNGTLWLNLGDSYCSAKGSCFNPGGGESSYKDYRKEAGVIPLARPNLTDARAWGLKQKDLIGIPWLVAFALRADGWYLRQDIIWAKPNPMPESVTDRCTKSHEYLFMLTKSPRYYYNAAAIRTPAKDSADDLRRIYGRQHDGNKSTPDEKQNSLRVRTDKQRGHSRRHDGFNDRWDAMPKDEQCARGANKRDVWFIATRPYPEAHFATFPEALVEPCIKAGCPPEGIVLDPFCGSGTVGAVAVKLGRSFVGIELNSAYVELARARTTEAQGPLFEQGAARAPEETK